MTLSLQGFERGIHRIKVKMLLGNSIFVKCAEFFINSVITYPRTLIHGPIYVYFVHSV